MCANYGDMGHKEDKFWVRCKDPDPTVAVVLDEDEEYFDQSPQSRASRSINIMMEGEEFLAMERVADVHPSLKASLYNGGAPTSRMLNPDSKRQKKQGFRNKRADKKPIRKIATQKRKKNYLTDRALK